MWDGLEPEARLTDRAGRLVRIVRWEQPDPTATQEMFDIWLTRALDAMPPEARPQFSASVEDAILPERIPALVGIRSNRRGRGLLVLYPRPDEPSRITPDLWTMSADGRLESRIRGVSPIEPLPLDPDRVVAVEEDELDVPRVRIRAMVRVRSGG